jgi:hypothetical protein
MQIEKQSKKWTKKPKTLDPFYSRFELRTGAKVPGPRPPARAHVDTLLPRFVSEPGVKACPFTPDCLVPNEQPGVKALTNRG